MADRESDQEFLEHMQQRIWNYTLWTHEEKARLLALALDGLLFRWIESADNSKDMGSYFEVRTGEGIGTLRERISARMTENPAGSRQPDPSGTMITVLTCRHGVPYRYACDICDLYPGTTIVADETYEAKIKAQVAEWYDAETRLRRMVAEMEEMRRAVEAQRTLALDLQVRIDCVGRNVPRRTFKTVDDDKLVVVQHYSQPNKDDPTTCTNWTTVSIEDVL